MNFLKKLYKKYTDWQRQEANIIIGDSIITTNNFTILLFLLILTWVILNILK